MLQCRGDADLAEEALGAERGGDLGPEGLDRDLPTVLQVAGEQDPRHPATTDFPFDRVALAQRTLQERDEVTHGLLRHNTAECLGWLPVPKWFTPVRWVRPRPAGRSLSSASGGHRARAEASPPPSCAVGYSANIRRARERPEAAWVEGPYCHDERSEFRQAGALARDPARTHRKPPRARG